MHPLAQKLNSHVCIMSCFSLFRFAALSITNKSAPNHNLRPLNVQLFSPILQCLHSLTGLITCQKLAFLSSCQKGITGVNMLHYHP